MKAEFLKPLSLAVLFALAGPLAAQEAGTTDGQAADTAAEPAAEDEAATGLSMGEVVDTTREPGTTYVDEVFGDWERKCVNNPDGEDPCQAYQLLKDASGTPTAEISLLRLPEGDQATAGATIVVPLETLLTQQLTIAVDGGATKRYPFRFCINIGCFAQIGLTSEEVAAFKRGVKATVTIVPASAPNQKVVLPVSLTGFTAVYDSLEVPAAN